MGLFSPVWRLCLFVPRDVLVLVFWWGRSQGEDLTGAVTALRLCINVIRISMILRCTLVQ